MAIDSAYVTWSEYKARVDQSSNVHQATVEAVILAASRLIERRTLRTFNQSAASTSRFFDGSDRAVLRVDDLVSIDAEGIAVDTEGDGTYTATTFDPSSEPWVLLEPYNAAELNRPYERLILRSISGATASVGEILTIWPVGRRRVRITGTWGWPAVPAEIKEAVVMLTRQVVDLERAGMTLTLANIDAGLQMAPGAASLLADIQRQFLRIDDAVIV